MGYIHLLHDLMSTQQPTLARTGLILCYCAVLFPLIFSGVHFSFAIPGIFDASRLYLVSSCSVLFIFSLFWPLSSISAAKVEPRWSLFIFVFV